MNLIDLICRKKFWFAGYYQSKSSPGAVSLLQSFITETKNSVISIYSNRKTKFNIEILKSRSLVLKEANSINDSIKIILDA